MPYNLKTIVLFRHIGKSIIFALNNRLKNMETLERMPFKARKAVFDRLEQIASGYGAMIINAPCHHHIVFASPSFLTNKDNIFRIKANAKPPLTLSTIVRTFFSQFSAVMDSGFER